MLGCQPEDWARAPEPQTIVITIISMYAGFFKRFFDFIVALCAILCIAPLFLLLMVLGCWFMGGNPFFVQARPGWHEKIFKLIKFRTMSNRKDAQGNLLPDEQRLNGYGKFLRSTSLDELPELLNILIGDMSLVGPRPLLVKYLPLYNEEQHHRHDVRPGLTGYAQVHGRNAVDWEERFKLDVYYARNLSFALDVRIIVKTFLVVFRREGIAQEGQVTMTEFKGSRHDEA